MYGRPCHSPLHWDEVGVKDLLGPQQVHDWRSQIELIRNNLLAAQSHQKSYADLSCRDLEFQVGDEVLLRVSPTKGVLRFRAKGKLNPQYDFGSGAVS